MMVTQTKKLFVFLFVGLVVFITQSAELSLEPTSVETNANVTQGMEDEQETTGEVVITDKDQAKEP